MKKALSVFLTLALMLSLLPGMAFAAEVSNNVAQAVCTRSEDCVAETHEEGCPKGISDKEADAAPAANLQTLGASTGHYHPRGF